MPVDVLRCRICESDYPALANGICVRCFGPLEPVYDWDALARPSSRASGSRPARTRSGATPTCCRRCRPRTRPTGPGMTPLVPAPRLARALGVGEVCSSSTWRTRPIRSRTGSSRSRPRRRASSGSTRSPATSTGNLANAVAARAAATGRCRGDLLPGRARGREAPRDHRLRRDDLRASGEATTTAAGSSASSRARSSGGSSTSTSAPTTRRDRRRSPSRSSSSSAGRRPTPS